MLPVMDSYIVRIYRRTVDEITGTVEAVEAGTRTGFGDGLELLAILGRPARVVEVRDAQPLAPVQPGRQKR